MNHRHVLIGLIAAASVGTTAAPLAASAADRAQSYPATRTGKSCEQRSGRNLNVVGLTADNWLVCFRENRAHRPRNVAAITGLDGDTSLVGIDFRPLDGVLYGLGNAGGIYTIDTTTAEAMKVAQANVALSGTDFGVDFNPTVDRLRVISDNGQNLAINVDDGVTATNTALTLAGAPAPGVTGAAYTNNDADPTTGTTLFDIDSTTDQVVVQAPPANGTLGPTGKLGVDTSAVVGFDIFADQQYGTTASNRALASLTVDGWSSLYSVDVLTGRAAHRGNFPADFLITDIAIPLDAG
jgi:Domain of unknown function (DUF4394)